MAKLLRVTCSVMAMAGAAWAGHASAEGVVIPQVPSDAAHVGADADDVLPDDDSADTKDYQAQVLSDPAINEKARATAVMNENGFSGNTAVVVQKGKSNSSTIRQEGTNNLAVQKQVGDSNDIHVEQSGDNNRSEEQQVGNHNHKVKIQNGKKVEETTGEEAN